MNDSNPEKIFQFGVLIHWYYYLYLSVPGHSSLKRRGNKIRQDKVRLSKWITSTGAAIY